MCTIYIQHHDWAQCYQKNLVFDVSCDTENPDCEEYARKEDYCCVVAPLRGYGAQGK